MFKRLPSISIKCHQSLPGVCLCSQLQSSPSENKEESPQPSAAASGAFSVECIGTNTYSHLTFPVVLCVGDETEEETPESLAEPTEPPANSPDAIQVSIFFPSRIRENQTCVLVSRATCRVSRKALMSFGRLTNPRHLLGCVEDEALARAIQMSLDVSWSGVQGFFFLPFDRYARRMR